jgi:hypothetical protein
MMVLRRLFIHCFLYVPLPVQLRALRLGCSVPQSMANLREAVYSLNVREGAFYEVELPLYGFLRSSARKRGIGA